MRPGRLLLLLAPPAAAAGRLFVPARPAVQPPAQDSALGWSHGPEPEWSQWVLSEGLLPPGSAFPGTAPLAKAPAAEGTSLLFGASAVVVSLAVGGAIGLLRENRQKMIEADEADSMIQLQMLSEKQAHFENRQLAASLDARINYFAEKETSLLETRQMLLEADEANSAQEMILLSEKLRLEEGRQTRQAINTGIQAAQDTVQDAVRQGLTAGEVFARSLPGSLPGVGFFDPLGILDGSTVEKVQYYRDAELKHGRIGTIAAIGILCSEAYHPFGGVEMNGVPAVFAFTQHNLMLQTVMVASAVALASRPQKVPNTERKQTTEIWHVRGGMLAAFGMIAEEAITNTCIVCG
jgi:hypothetical protein